ncbi:copper chaperone PCu(A)C [Rhizohabitans arisaemae]|uniref:copper chaperone PCu(A)C n=1 Tax=Rhizohabitans arisaemae TaxID=2720610 RepID=UPI0024B1C8DA|nr:copper chaperone PCu(A)C [Rhizohabitans arisaemae]
MFRPSRRTGSRRGAIAIAAALVVAPALAGCGAGFDAQTLKPYHPTEGANKVERGISVLNAFILGPTPGQTHTAGSPIPVYLTVINKSGADDRFTVAGAEKTGSPSAPITAPVEKPVSVGAQSFEVFLAGAPAHRGGESSQLTLNFEKAGQITLHVPVIPRSREFATFPPLPGAPSPVPSPTPSATPTAEATEAAH